MTSPASMTTSVRIIAEYDFHNVVFCREQVHSETLHSMESSSSTVPEICIDVVELLQERIARKSYV